MPDAEPHDENLTEQTHHIIIPSYASWFDYNRFVNCVYCRDACVEYALFVDRLTSRVFNKSWWLAKFAGYFTWTRRLLFFGNYPSLNRVFMCCNRIKKSKLMMSVLCSHPLIFAPEWWKCILRGRDFIFFFHKLALASRAFAASFSLLRLLQSVCHLLKIVLKPCSWAAF